MSKGVKCAFSRFHENHCCGLVSYTRPKSTTYPGVLPSISCRLYVPNFLEIFTVDLHSGTRRMCEVQTTTFWEQIWEKRTENCIFWSEIGDAHATPRPWEGWPCTARYLHLTGTFPSWLSIELLTESVFKIRRFISDKICLLWVFLWSGKRKPPSERKRADIQTPFEYSTSR